MDPLNRSQIDALGDRLRDGTLQAEDVHVLAEFFESYETFGEETFREVAAAAAALPMANSGVLDVTARNTKTELSIRAKLQRQSTKLSQVQDIVGCRVLVADRAAQDALASVIRTTIHPQKEQDRRAAPTYGYRAVHFIVRDQAAGQNWRRFEIQLRTALQHQWASLVEALSQRFGLEVKYGGGPELIGQRLIATSAEIARYEERFPFLPRGGLTGNEEFLIERPALQKHFDALIDLWQGDNQE